MPVRQSALSKLLVGVCRKGVDKKSASPPKEREQVFTPRQTTDGIKEPSPSTAEKPVGEKLPP